MATRNKTVLTSSAQNSEVCKLPIFGDLIIILISLPYIQYSQSYRSASWQQPHAELSRKVGMPSHYLVQLHYVAQIIMCLTLYQTLHQELLELTYVY